MPDVAGADGVEADGAGADGAGADGAGAVGCVCASASDIVSIVAGTPKPNAAASPRREKAPRREILFSLMSSLPGSILPPGVSIRSSPHMNVV